MGMILPVTPQKKVTYSQPSSLAKSSHSSNKSQVRFSLPDPDISINSNDYNQDNSPLKIVYPTDNSVMYGEANRNPLEGQFMDIQSKVMVDVPEEVWRFHNNRRHINKELIENNKLHKRSKSLQSIIYSTIENINQNNGIANLEVDTDLSMVSNVSPLNLHKRNNSLPPVLLPQNPELYLTTESPLNKYNVPVPLQILLPPYLSPKNKNKQRRSVIYDGDGYSVFNGDSSMSSSYSGYSQENSVGDSVVDSIISSIASAEHNISLNDLLDNSDENIVDKALGFDEDANVNLKLQNRNIRKRTDLVKINQLNKSEHFTIPKIPQPKERKQEKSPSRKLSNKDSLSILATPTKQIQLPELNFENNAKSFSGTLKFLDSLESSSPLIDSAGESKRIKFNTNSDNDGTLSKTFKFPTIQSEVHETIESNLDTNNDDFIITNTSKTSKEFENRRHQLVQNQSTPNNNKLKSPAHKRSRSIHTAEGIFIKPTDNYGELLSQSDIDLTIPYTNNASTRLSERLPLGAKLTSYSEKITIPITNDTLIKQIQNIENNIIDPFPITMTPNGVGVVRMFDKIEREDEVKVEVEEGINDGIELSLYEEDSNSIIESSITAEKSTTSDLSLENMTNYSFQELTPHNDTNEEPIQIISEIQNGKENKLSQLVSRSPLKADLDHILVKPIDESNHCQVNVTKPLASFQSFSIPVTVKDADILPFVPSISSIQPLIKREKERYNTLIGRAGSKTESTSSYSSNFSKQSYQTSISSYQNAVDHYYSENPNINSMKQADTYLKNLEYYISPTKPREKIPNKNSSEKDLISVYEQVNGRIVEVFVIDDDFLSDTVDIKNSKNLLSPNEKSLGLSKKVKGHKRTKSCPSGVFSYKDILTMCEETADQAKTVIYDLVNKDHANNTTIKAISKPTPPSVDLSKYSTSLLKNGLEKYTIDSLDQVYQEKGSHSNNVLMNRNKQERFLFNMHRSVKSFSNNNSVYV